MYRGGVDLKPVFHRLIFGGTVAALVTVGVNVLQAGRQAQAMGHGQGLVGRGRYLAELERGEELGHMPGRALAEVVMHPLRDSAQFVGVVVLAGDDIGAGLDVDAELLSVFYRVQHLGDGRGWTDVFVERIAEALDVRAQHIDMRGDQLQRLVGNEAVGHVQGVEPRAVGLGADIEYVFQPYRRLRVGEGDALHPLSLRQCDQLRGGDIGGTRLTLGELVQRLDTPGDVEIVAATAAEAAPVAADRQHPGAGAEMTYRLVLDAIDGDRRQDAVGEIVQRAVTVDVGLTKAALTMGQLAAPQTQIAAGGTARQLLL